MAVENVSLIFAVGIQSPSNSTTHPESGSMLGLNSVEANANSLHSSESVVIKVRGQELAPDR